MKKISKFLIGLSLIIGLFACSSLPTEEDSANTTKSSVKFTMQNVNATSSNVLFSSTESETPSKVAISYRKSGESEEISTIIELTAFGSSYITDDVLSLDEGTYEVTRFDVLNDSGTTIYSTPKAESKFAKILNITTTLDYSFSVNEGKISTVTMQVVAVDEGTDPADFGHTAFTFEKVSYNRFYIEALILDDNIGWTYTSANVKVTNSNGSIIESTTISEEVNRILITDDDSYTITVSKDGYLTQILTFTKDELAVYKAKIMVIKLKKSEEETEKSFYMEALVPSGSTWKYTDALVEITCVSKNVVNTDTIIGEKNKIIVANDTFYTITVSKSGYITQTFSITKDNLSLYENEALKVKLEAKNNNKYQLINKSLSWSEAKAYCESLGGHLVTITSQEEQKYIFDSIIVPNSVPCSWAGGTDSEKEGTWKWITGEEWTYKNWNPVYSEPNGGTGENNLILYPSATDINWADYGDGHTIFICEWNSEADMLDAYPTITYDANGGNGSVPSVSTTKLDEVIIASGSNLSKAGYTFIGWSTDSSATSITYTTGQKMTFTSSTTLYAVWKNNSLYKLIYKSLSWSEAKAYCEELGGHLVTIASQEEQKYIFDNIIVPNNVPCCWAGGTDAEKEGTWKWITGEEWTYSNWGSTYSEPNGGTGENNLILYPSATDINWADYGGGHTIFICEWENEADM